MPKLIIVKYIDPFIFTEKNKFNVQVAGYKDKTPMKLEVWRIPCDTAKEADEMCNKIKSSNGMLIIN